MLVNGPRRDALRLLKHLLITMRRAVAQPSDRLVAAGTMSGFSRLPILMATSSRLLRIACGGRTDVKTAMDPSAWISTAITRRTGAWMTPARRLFLHQRHIEVRRPSRNRKLRRSLRFTRHIHRCSPLATTPSQPYPVSPGHEYASFGRPGDFRALAGTDTKPAVRDNLPGPIATTISGPGWNLYVTNGDTPTGHTA